MIVLFIFFSLDITKNNMIYWPKTKVVWFNLRMIECNHKLFVSCYCDLKKIQLTNKISIMHVFRGNRSYKPNPRLTRALDIIFILHAEHEMNCSTSTVRHLASRWILLLKQKSVANQPYRVCVQFGLHSKILKQNNAACYIFLNYYHIFSGVDVYTAIAGAVGALYGPLHGGANEVIWMAHDAFMIIFCIAYFNVERRMLVSFTRVCQY